MASLGMALRFQKPIPDQWPPCSKSDMSSELLLQLYSCLSVPMPPHPTVMIMASLSDTASKPPIKFFLCDTLVIVPLHSHRTVNDTVRVCTCVRMRVHCVPGETQDTDTEGEVGVSYLKLEGCPGELVSIGAEEVTEIRTPLRTWPLNRVC